MSYRCPVCNECFDSKLEFDKHCFDWLDDQLGELHLNVEQFYGTNYIQSEVVNENKNKKYTTI